MRELCISPVAADDCRLVVCWRCSVVVPVLVMAVVVAAVAIVVGEMVCFWGVEVGIQGQGRRKRERHSSGNRSGRRVRVWRKRGRDLLEISRYFGSTDMHRGNLE